MAVPIATRLNWCLTSGRLTVSDLALWFDRAYPTVRNWVLGGVLPRGPRTVKLLQDLERLESMIRGHRGLPVPYDIGHLERPAYIRKLRNGRNAKLPQRRSA